MKIPILQDNYINTGDRTIQTPRLPAPDNSAISKGVQSLGSNISVLFQKKQDADDLSSLIDLDLELDKERLDFEKWKNDPNNQTAGEGRDLTQYWEENARERANKINEKWNSVKMTNETKLRAQSKIDNFANNIITDAYGSAFRQSGQNYKSRLDTMISTGERLNDPSYIERAREYANAGVEKGIFNPLEAELVNESLNGRKQNIEMKNFTSNLENDILAENYEAAYNKISEAEKNGIIDTAKADNYRANVRYKAEYGSNLERAKMEIETDPKAYLEKSETPSQTGGDPTIEFIKSVEGFTPTAAWDYAQTSVGYGTRGKPGETITKEEAEKRLISEMKTHENRVDKLIADNNLTLNANQRAALISYDYNTGRVEGIFNKIGNDPNKIPDALRSGIVTANGQVLQGLKNRREKEAKLAEGAAPLLRSGSFKPEDQFALDTMAKEKLGDLASSQARTLKEAMDIGQIPPDKVLEIINTDDAYSQLRGNIPEVKLMRDSLAFYGQQKIGKSLITSNAFYGELDTKVIDFASRYNKASGDGQKMDSTQARNMELEKVALLTEIENKTQGEATSLLKQKLKDSTDAVDGRRKTALTSEANKLMTSAFNAGKFGQWKKKEAKLVQIEDKDRPITEADITSNTLLNITDKNGKIIRERSVPTAEDIANGYTTGKDRWVIATSSQSGISYRSPVYEKQKDGTMVITDYKITKVKPEDVASKIVYEESEDLDIKATASQQMAAINDELAFKIKTGEIKSREEAVRFVSSKIGQKIGPTSTTAPNPISTTPIGSSRNTLDAARKARESLLKK